MPTTISVQNRERLIRFGVRISALRAARGLSQMELAQRAGVSRVTLQNIENPNRVYSCSLDVFLNLARALGMTPSELIAEPDNSGDT